MERTVKKALVIAVLVTLCCGVYARGPTAPGPAIGRGDIKIPYEGPEVTISVYCLGADVESRMAHLVNQETVKRLGNINLDITLASIQEYDQKLSLMYAAGDLYDINGIRQPWQQSNTYGATGIFLDYEKYKRYMPNFQREVRKRPWFNYMLNPDGTRYALPGQNYDKDYFMEAWACNQTILDKHGVEIPETSDEFMEAMKKLKRSDPDVYPWIFVWGMGPIIDVFGSMFDKYSPRFPIYSEEDEEWYFGPIDERSSFKEVLLFMNEMYQYDLFDPEQETHNVEQYLATAQRGLWGFTFMYVNMTRPGQMRKNVEDYEIAPMYAPKGPNGEAYYWVTVGFDQINYWGNVSNSQTEYPELVCTVLDWMFSEEATELFNWGVEGVTFQFNADGEREYLPDFITGANPTGTKNLRTEYGVGWPILPFTWLSEVHPSSLQSQNADSYTLVEKAIEGLVSGRHSGPYFVQPLRPIVTPDEGDMIAEIMTPINTYIRENMVKFIKGDRGFDTWDSFVSDIRKLGDIDWVMELYNTKDVIVRAKRNYRTYWKD
jgi:putative aldouronate transport system substrate-binding protein